MDINVEKHTELENAYMVSLFGPDDEFQQFVIGEGIPFGRVMDLLTKWSTHKETS